MNTTEQFFEKNVTHSKNRIELWIRFLYSCQAKNLAEVGVYKGNFAANILKECNFIEKYYMIDPWRNLDNWNKPANQDDHVFEQILKETKLKTDFAADKRIILRGKTTEVIEEIPDNELDFAYIDGDHTLKGISIDLIRLFPKIRTGGWIGGDDFNRKLWQHDTSYEPTLVFPYAVYFAEAVGTHIYGLPFNQFLMEKSNAQQFKFVDLTGLYDDVSLRDQFHPDQVLKLKLKETFPWLSKAAKRLIRS